MYAWSIFDSKSIFTISSTLSRPSSIISWSVASVPSAETTRSCEPFSNIKPYSSLSNVLTLNEPPASNIVDGFLFTVIVPPMASKLGE